MSDTSDRDDEIIQNCQNLVGSMPKLVNQIIKIVVAISCGDDLTNALPAKNMNGVHRAQVYPHDINTKLFQRITAAGDIGRSPARKSTLLLESILKPSTDIFYKNKRLSQLESITADSSNFTDSSPEFLCQVVNMSPILKKTPSGQKIRICVTPECKKAGGTSTSVKRMIERSPSGIGKKRRKVSVRSLKCGANSLSGCEKLEQILRPRESMCEFKNIKADERLNRGRNHHRSYSNRSGMADGRAKQPTIVATSLPSEDREFLVCAVKAFGVYKLAKDVTQSTSHVVCGEKRRTLSILKAITRGCWIVSIQWVIRSIEAQKWVDEEAYELADYFPANRISRVNRSKSDGAYFPDIFSSVGPIFISSSVTLHHSELQNLVISCQGQITGCHKKAVLSVGRYFKELPCVTERWIFDSVTEHKVMDYSIYSLSMSV